MLGGGAEDTELSDLGMWKEICFCSLVAAKTVYLPVCFSRKWRPAEEKRPSENISTNLRRSSREAQSFSDTSGISRGQDEAGLRLETQPRERQPAGSAKAELWPRHPWLSRAKERHTHTSPGTPW